MLARATRSLTPASCAALRSSCTGAVAGPSRVAALSLRYASTESTTPSAAAQLPQRPAADASQPRPPQSTAQSAQLAAAGPLTPLGYTKDNLPTSTDPTLAFFVGILMRDGKKAKANRAVLDVLALLNEWTSAPPLPLFQQAIARASPLVRMQSSKSGGKITQIPVPLNPRQAAHRGIKGIIEASKKRSDRYLSTRLAREILAVLEGSSSVLQRKEEQHKVAMANRANASVRI